MTEVRMTKDVATDINKLTTQDVLYKIKEEIDKNSLKNLIRQESWEDAFKRTMIIKENIMTISDDRHVELLVDSTSANKPTCLWKMAERTLQIKDAIKKKPGTGTERPHCKQKQSANRRRKLGKRRHIFLEGTDEQKGEKKGLYQLFKATMKLRKVMEQKGQSKLALPIQKEWKQDICQTVIECILCDSPIEAVLCFPQIQKVEGQKKTDLGGALKNKIKAEAVLVEAGGKTYPELLKDVKKMAKNKDMRSKVRSLKKTRGDLLLTMESHNGKAAPFVQVLVGVNGTATLKR